MADAYVNDATVNDYYGGKHYRYEAPPLTEDAPYYDAPNLGWAPTLQPGYDAVPDVARLGHAPTRDFHRGMNGSPSQFYQDRDADDAARHHAETVVTHAATPLNGVAAGDRRFVDNPNLTTVPESRTQRTPWNYRFTRPFGSNTEKMGSKHLSGDHFSMADHKRDYEIGGMIPVSTRRNTFRQEPEPWDTDMVDVGPAFDPSPSRKVVSVEVEAPSRTWRL